MNLDLPKKRKIVIDAPVLKRLMAFIVDLLFINLAIITPFRKLLQGFFGESIAWTVPANIPFYVYFSLFSMVFLAWAYFSLTQYFLNQTVGMKLLKLELKGELSFAKSFLRNIYVWPFFPFYLLWIVEPIVILIKKQGLLDKLTHTKMIQSIEMV